MSIRIAYTRVPTGLRACHPPRDDNFLIILASVPWLDRSCAQIQETREFRCYRTGQFYLLTTDDPVRGIRQHPQAVLWPSEMVPLGLLHALKGVGNRAFYRWLRRASRALFPYLAERTRGFRLFKTPQGLDF
jgi:hypothetical protein